MASKMASDGRLAAHPPHPQKILVVATRQIGDVLLTTPLIRAARQQWPHAEIDVIGLAGTLGMLNGNPDVHRLITSTPSQGWRDTLGLLKTLWNRYDLALITQPSDRAHLIGWTASKGLRSGLIPSANPSNWWKKSLLSHVVESQGDGSDTHVVMEKLALLAPWREIGQGEAQVRPPPGSPLPAELEASILPGAIVVHAPSMWTYKQWPIAHFRQLIEALIRAGHQVVLTGSAGENDQRCVAQLRDVAASPQLLDTSGQLNWNQLTTLFRRAALYIGPDTSVTHLAAACGIKVVALFGPTNPARWGPWAAQPDGPQPEAPTTYAKRMPQQTVRNTILLQSTLACVPCSKAGCEDHNQSRSDCLIDISPERVFELVQKQLPPPSTTQP